MILSRYIRTFLSAVCVFCALLCLEPARLTAADEVDSQAEQGGDEYFTTKMGRSLWDTLIESGVDPTQWRYVFDFNRENNPAFARIKSANRIPRGVTIYIPLETGDESPVKRRAVTRPSASTVQDTVKFFGDEPFLLIKAGRGQRLGNVVRQFCIPDGIDDKRLRENMERTVASDIRDIYRRAGQEYSSRASSFYLPLYLTRESFVSLSEKVDRPVSSPEHYVPRDSILPPDSSDIHHIASEDESYIDLADRYVPAASEWPETYVFHKNQDQHLLYMAQQIRHYNMNQPLWPGKVYNIPSYLLNGRYTKANPVVKLKKSNKTRLVYDNGLEVSLEKHVTRRKAYSRYRQRFLPPLERKLEDGRPAFPDMILWHRTGIEPEIEKILREKKRGQFSLNYIYRMAVCNFYIDENGKCFLIVDPDKNSRDHSGNPVDYRCFWNGQSRVSDVSIGIEIEAWFTTRLTSAQLSTARKLQQLLRSMYIIPDERVLDHKKVAARRGPDKKLLRGRKADGLTAEERLAIGIDPVLDPDVLRGLVDPNLNDMLVRRADSTDYWFNVDPDPDLIATSRLIGWNLIGDTWTPPPSLAKPAIREIPASLE